VILFKRQIDIFYLFIGYLGYSINRILCLLFSTRKEGEYSMEPKTQKKRTSTLRYNNLSLLKKFRRFLTSSCGLPLKAGYLDDLWFVLIFSCQGR
jgi:hypothetical protein